MTTKSRGDSKSKSSTRPRVAKPPADGVKIGRPGSDGEVLPPLFTDAASVVAWQKRTVSTVATLWYAPKRGDVVPIRRKIDLAAADDSAGCPVAIARLCWIAKQPNSSACKSDGEIVTDPAIQRFHCAAVNAHNLSLILAPAWPAKPQCVGRFREVILAELRAAEAGVLKMFKRQRLTPKTVREFVRDCCGVPSRNVGHMAAVEASLENLNRRIRQHTKEPAKRRRNDRSPTHGNGSKKK
jgi:hypothetical protein